MSKKKATMTLKDFHGGSIPSDLPLPSAPGVIVRPADRGGFDRQNPWGNSMGRSDHRLRPASASSVRNLDDKTPFLTQSSHIGRNFDEDERKPLDGVSGPRRTVSDEVTRAQPTHAVGPKMDNLSGAGVGSRVAQFPISQVSSGSISNSYAGMVNEVHNVGLNKQNIIGNRGYGSNYPNMDGSSGQPVSGSYPNAWGIRKETVSIKEPVSAAWSAPDAAKKLANASALDKISSGRWNSKQGVQPVKDAQVYGHLETEREFLHKANNVYDKINYNRLDVVGETKYHDVSLEMHAERSLAVDDGIRGVVKDKPTYEQLKSTMREESYERNPSINANGNKSPRPTGKYAETESSAFPLETSERPKLKLLPRSRPVESSDQPVDSKGYQQSSDHLHVEPSYGVHEPSNPAQSALTVSLAGNQAVERPKLNLKPRSQPVEQLEGKNETGKRGTVFGGARPRELVLKERGIEDLPVSSNESRSALRVKEDAPKVDQPVHVPPTRYSIKADNVPSDPRALKYTDRRDQQLDGDRIDSLRRNRRNDIRRDSKEVEKHRNPQHQQQMQERPPSPETWRKPVEQARPASADSPPVRHGKVASAVELAQAFSKPISGTKLSGTGGVASRGEIPFSRLTGPTPRARVNGY